LAAANCRKLYVLGSVLKSSVAMGSAVGLDFEAATGPQCLAGAEDGRAL